MARFLFIELSGFGVESESWTKGVESESWTEGAETTPQFWANNSASCLSFLPQPSTRRFRVDLLDLNGDNRTHFAQIASHQDRPAELQSFFGSQSG